MTCILYIKWKTSIVILGKAEYFWSEKRRNVTLEKAFVAAIPVP